jgi:hypothetical protein
VSSGHRDRVAGVEQLQAEVEGLALRSAHQHLPERPTVLVQRVRHQRDLLDGIAVEVVNPGAVEPVDHPEPGGDAGVGVKLGGTVAGTVQTVTRSPAA